jgi:hypothetical protein
MSENTRENALKGNTPTKAQIAAAKIQSTKYMRIEFGYSLRLVLPYKDGLIVMAGLENAEHFSYLSEDTSVNVIKPLAYTEAPKASCITEEDYIDLKMSQLFKASVTCQ